MSRNGSGTYSLPVNSWNPATNGVSATPADWQSLIDDVEAALTQSVSKDGQTTMTGNLPMGGFKLTGLGAGSATGQSVRWEQLFSQGTEADIASATTTTLGTQNTNFLRVTGTTTITSFGTTYNGPRFLRFEGALTLTHSATLILPTGANITTAAGDLAIAIPKATLGTADGWYVFYQRADGAVTPAQVQAQTYTAFTTGGTSSAFTLTPTPAITAYAENQSFDVEFNAASTGTPTLNISGVGAKNLKYRDALGALVSCGTLIPSGWRSKVTYDGTDMIVREMPTAVLTVGQGRMTKVGSDLVFARYQGRFLTANGVIYEIPSGGVTIAPTSNTADTLYYQYAVISGGAISSTGEYSATGYTVGSDGVAYKTGDTSRVFLGVWRSGTSGGTWSSIATEGRSWFNRGSVSATIKKSGANLSCTSSSLAEVDSAFRGGFVCWADDVVSITLASTVGVSTTNTYSNMSLYVDGADWTALPSIQQDYDTTSNSYDRRTSGVGSLSEGHHTAQLWALVTAAHTFTLSGGDFTRFQIEVSG